MNEKITLPNLINLLALHSGETKKVSEDFVKEMFVLIAEGLIDDEIVKVKDLGVFKAVAVEARKSVNVSTGEEHTIPAHRKVTFSPSKELAALVNEPFEMFETIELPADDQEEQGGIDREESSIYALPEEEDEEMDITTGIVPEYSISETAQDNDIESGNQPSPEPVQPSDEDVDGYTKTTLDAASEDAGESVESAELTDSINSDSVDFDTIDSTSDDSDSKSDWTVTEEVAPAEVFADVPPMGEGSLVVEEETGKSRKHKKKAVSHFLLGFLCGVVAAAIIGVVMFFCFRYLGMEMLSGIAASPVTVTAQEVTIEENVPSEDRESSTAAVITVDSRVSEEVSESEDVAPTKPSDSLVYDTITNTRFLGTMATEHYGNYNFWPYIYMENKSFLGHPDRIRPGTRVVIPPLSKYGIDPKNPADMQKAKRAGVEIYSRYK